MGSRKSGLSPDNPGAIQRLMEMVRVWNGEGRNKGDRVITAKELKGTKDALNQLGVDPGLDVGVENPEGTFIDKPPGGSATIPGEVSGLSASAAFRTAIVKWDAPTYQGHAQTEIWRSLDDVFANAALVSSTGAYRFSDGDIQSGTQYWYWIRHVSRFGVKGPLSSSVTTTSAVDVEYLINELSGQISQSELAQDLVTWQEGLESQYTVKVGSNGGVGGFGLASTPNDDMADGDFTEFYVNAERFAILPQNKPLSDAKSPFIVENNAVHIDTALIREADITDAQIASVTADTIDVTQLDAVSADMGTITAGRMESPDGHFIIDLTGKQILITV